MTRKNPSIIPTPAAENSTHEAWVDSQLAAMTREYAALFPDPVVRKLEILAALARNAAMTYQFDPTIDRDEKWCDRAAARLERLAERAFERIKQVGGSS